VEPTNRPDLISRQSQEIFVAPKNQSKTRRLIKLICKYWYVVLVLLILILAFITWLAIQSSQDAAWKRANDYFTRADYSNAEKQLHSMAMPSDTSRLQVYAQTMFATQNLDKSLVAYKKLYDITKDPSIEINIGNIYNQQKKYDQAIKVYQEMISNNASNIQAYVNLSTVYKLQGNNSDAIKTANQGVKNNPASVVLRELQVSMVMEDKSSAAYKLAVKGLKTLNPSDPLLQALNE